jgi:hypothetical protein
MAVVDQIGQAAGGGNDDIDAAVKLADLRHTRHSAQHQRGRDLGATGQHTNMLFDLHRQLTGRGQDQGAGGLRRRTAREREQVMQDRQHEGGGLAGAGLGDAEDVAPLKLRADRLRLDRGRGGEFGALQRRCQRGGEAEIRERSSRIRDRSQKNILSAGSRFLAGNRGSVTSQAHLAGTGLGATGRAFGARSALSLPRGAQRFSLLAVISGKKRLAPEFTCRNDFSPHDPEFSRTGRCVAGICGVPGQNARAISILVRATGLSLPDCTRHLLAGTCPALVHRSSIRPSR